MGIIIKFVSGKYENDDAVHKLVNYILRKEARNPNGYNIYGSLGTYHKSTKGIIKDFIKTKNIYHQNNGVQIKHLVISFSTPPELPRKIIKKKLLKTVGFFTSDYQIVYAVHEDTDKFHIHIGLNSVSAKTGKKFNFRANDKRKFDKHVKKIWNESLEYENQIDSSGKP